MACFAVAMALKGCPQAKRAFYFGLSSNWVSVACARSLTSFSRDQAKDLRRKEGLSLLVRLLYTS